MQQSAFDRHAAPPTPHDGAQYSGGAQTEPLEPVRGLQHPLEQSLDLTHDCAHTSIAGAFKSWMHAAPGQHSSSPSRVLHVSPAFAHAGAAGGVGVEDPPASASERVTEPPSAAPSVGRDLRSLRRTAQASINHKQQRSTHTHPLERDSLGKLRIRTTCAHAQGGGEGLTRLSTDTKTSTG